jgi:hypothetical protein
LPNGAIFGAGDDERKRRMEAGNRHVVSVAFESLHAGLVLVIPHLEQPDPDKTTNQITVRGRRADPTRERERGERSALVVGTADDVGLVTTGEVLDSVDTLIVAFQSEVGNGRAQTPHLDTAEKLDG